MTEVLESLTRAGQAPEGPGREELARAMKHAELQFLRQSLGMPTQPSLEQLQELRSHAGYLDLLAGEVGPEQAGDAFLVAGTIFEWLATLQPSPASDSLVGRLTTGPTGDLLKAAMLYASGSHEPGAAVAAERAHSRFTELAKVRDAEPIFDAAAHAIFALLQTDYDALFRAIVEYGRAVEVVRTKGEVEATEGSDQFVDWASIGLVSRAAESAAVLATAMRTGSDDLFADVGRRRDEWMALARTSGHPLLHSFLARLSRAMDSIASRSTYRVLRSAGLRPQRVAWQAALTPELWSTQVEAIMTGALDPSGSFVLALPTGSGKTAVAHLRILATLDEHPDSWVAYLAPSRALVRQAHRDLSKVLSPLGVRVRKLVAGAEAAVLTANEEVPSVSTAQTCVILTPERLDIYIRARPEMLDTCRLVVVDEVHHIGDASRGPRLEGLISEILTKWPLTRLLLLSAFLPNASELSAWLGVPDSNYQSDQRPTRQVRGFCARYASERLADRFVYRVGRRHQEFEAPQPLPLVKTKRHGFQFKIGAVVATSPADADGGQVIGLPELGEGTIWTVTNARGISKTEAPGPTDIAAQIASRLVRHPGLVLVFLPNTQWTETVCEAVASLLPEKPSLFPYAAAAAALLGVDDHPLVRGLRRGCAYHNARLPEEALRIVEAAAETRELELLCATSGLQAGVNLPAAVVLVVGGTEPGRLSPTYVDFANMAGRAGRPRWDTEGLVLYAWPQLAQSRAPATLVRRYLQPTEAELRVDSELAERLELLMSVDHDIALGDVDEGLQQILLGLFAVGVQSIEEVQSFVSHTFGSANLNASLLAERIVGAIDSALLDHPATFAAYSRTALPFLTCVDLENAARMLAERVAADQWPVNVSEQVGEVVRLVCGVPYFKSRVDGRLRTQDGAGPAAEFISAWVQGAGYEQLGQLLAARIGGKVDLARTVSVISDLTGYLAWGAGSLLAIAVAQQAQLAVDARLAYYIRFGVANPVAAYLRLIGLSDRAGAMRLATLYPKEANIDLDSVERWSRSRAGRAAVESSYPEDQVMLRTISIDLGFDDVLPRMPTRFEISAGADWALPGTFVEFERVGNQSVLRSVVGGQQTTVAGTPTLHGLGIVTSRSGDVVRGYSIGRDDE